MKPYLRLPALILALLLLGGCIKFQLEPKQPEPEVQSDDPEPAEPQPKQPFPDGEPVDWEEEWPEEYVVDGYRLEDGAIAQAGELNKYRYSQLDGAERYMDIVALYVQRFLGDDLGMEEDSPHDGYANWFYTGKGGTASVSGSSITGRFSYSLQPDFGRILDMTETQIADPAAMEQAAWDFAGRFAGITGELELLDAKAQEAYYQDVRSNELKNVTVPVMVYTFRAKEFSGLDLDIQDGLPAPVACGDSEIADLNVHCFRMTVWPDGTVVGADNYITRAGVTADGTANMIAEDDLPRLLNYFTSTAEHDTVVFDSIRADHFSVYFGGADIEPALTVEYHFDSDPDQHFSTEFVLPGLLDSV